MKPVLVAYGTSEGQTRKIARFIAERIRAADYEVDLVDAASPEAASLSPIYIGAVLGASVHQEHHQSNFVQLLKSNHAWLNGIPTALFSVSLAAASIDGESRDEAQKLLDDLAADSNIEPALTRCIAGALLYTRYDYLKRMIMRLITKREGGPTDTSQDYEFTDWDDVALFADAFLRKL